MDVDILGQPQFRAFAKRLSATVEGKAIRTHLTKRLQAVAAPVVGHLRAALMAVDSRGVKGRGTLRRERSYRVNRPKGRVKVFGLRATIARGIKSRVKYSGRTVGLRISIDAGHMPNRQRRLPAHLDNPRGWRHPVWGHRTRSWAHQYGQPYFRTTMRRDTPLVRTEVVAAINDAMKELQS